MSWYKKPYISAFCLCLLLTSCGFTPVHRTGNGVSVAQAYADIEIAPIPDRNGQYLRNALIDRIYTQGRPSTARYMLRIAPLKTSTTDLGIQKDATVTRTEIEIETQMELVDQQTNTVVLTRHMRAVGGYDVLDAQYATLVTKQDVTEHVLTELSDNILTALNLYFQAHMQ